MKELPTFDELTSTELSATAPVSANKTFDLSVQLHEYQGRAAINWSQNYPGMVRLAVALYSGTPPTNPTDWISGQAIEVTNRPAGMFLTNQPWGTGYSAALLGVNASNHAWVYIGVTTSATS
ncbi:MAG: hypothetical protein HRT35_34340 [Algicola sp.]|nr:hypothetical protein [Algicola sp.]